MGRLTLPNQSIDWLACFACITFGQIESQLIFPPLILGGYHTGCMYLSAAAGYQCSNQEDNRRDGRKNKAAYHV